MALYGPFYWGQDPLPGGTVSWDSPGKGPPPRPPTHTLSSAARAEPAGRPPGLTFGSEQRGVAGLVAERLPVMLGGGHGHGVRAVPGPADPPPEWGESHVAPAQPQREAHLGMAPGRQRLAAALTLQAELVPVLAQRAHLLSWGERRPEPTMHPLYSSGPTLSPWSGRPSLPQGCELEGHR